MGPLGWPETIFIGVLALLLFGPKKLPELGRTLGRAITEFRRASSELKSTFDREMRSLEREVESAKEVAGSHFQDSYNYDYSSYDSGNPYGTEYASNEQSPAALEPASHSENGTLGASAAQGADSTAQQTALTVRPAEGIVASGSLDSGHAATTDVHPETGSHEEPAREAMKS